MTGADTGGLGRVFNEVPELYDRTRPTYPDALFADLAGITGLGRQVPAGSTVKAYSELGSELSQSDGLAIE